VTNLRGNLIRLGQLLYEATPRPWRLDAQEMYLWGPGREMVADTTTQYEKPPAAGDVALRIRGHGAGLPQRQNGALVEAAVNALPELIAVVELALSIREVGHIPPCRCNLCRALLALDDALSTPPAAG
jgi:hypothetical protein